MRIVGGAWRGRVVLAPKGDNTRPTTDRVREALFSALEARMGSGLDGAVVLDAFAGSGALGLEALSRGARFAVFVEQDRKAIATLEVNIAALGAKSASKVLKSDAFKAPLAAAQGAFALILLDPPYTLDAAKVGDMLESLARNGQVEDGCVVSWEHATGKPVCWPAGFVVQASKRYGTTEIDIAAFGEGSEG